ncbi:MAG: adenylate kinase [Fimbriimonadaceae bacterium]|nr:adenylate kinase [Fimbriimonadaceae bacterium]
MRLVLIGPPGVGKGTQAGLLKSRLGVRHLASGNVFRAEIDAASELGRLAKTYIDRGELVPDDITVSMMIRHLEAEHKADTGFVLDGFPRTVRQAEELDKRLAELGKPIQSVVSIDVPDDVLVERLSGRRICPKGGEVYHTVYNPPQKPGVCDNCQVGLITRSDDLPETVRERLRVFHESTEPVIAHYRKKGVLRPIDGMEDLEHVYAALVRASYE